MTNTKYTYFLSTLQRSYFITGEQINPHELKELCDLYIKNKIYGCGKPFEIDNELKAVI